MECLELDVLAFVPEEVHHHLEIGLVGYVPRHYVEICPIEEDLAKELQRLSFRDVVVGEYKSCKRRKELAGISIRLRVDE